MFVTVSVFPLTVNVCAPPAFIVRYVTVALVLSVTFWARGITTLSVGAGTPPLQFAAVFHCPSLPAPRNLPRRDPRLASGGEEPRPGVGVLREALDAEQGIGRLQGVIAKQRVNQIPLAQ